MRNGGPISAVALALAFALLLTGCLSSKSGGGVAAIDAQSPPVSASPQADAQKRADIRLQLAVGYYEHRQFDVALEEATRALQAMPDFADAYDMRALVHMEMGASHLAEADFQRALRLQPDNPNFANNYGWFLCNDNRAGKAMAYFEAAAAHRSYRSPSKALVNAGTCSLKMQDAQAAERYFSRAFRHAPENTTTNLNLTKLYFDQRAFERARFHIGLVSKNALSADMLWLAIKIEHKLRNQTAENHLAAQLHRRYPSSSEYAAYQRGAFDE